MNAVKKVGNYLVEFNKKTLKITEPDYKLGQDFFEYFNTISNFKNRIKNPNIKNPERKILVKVLQIINHVPELVKIVK